VTRSGGKITKAIRTDRRIPIPEKTIFVGGNTWEKKVQVHGMNDKESCGTYETNAVAKDFICGEGMQPFDNGSEPLEQLGIAFPEFLKRPGLFLEYLEDRIGAVAAIDFVGEWMVAKIFPSLLGVVRQGSIEKVLEVGGCGG
jgi:hypothetical protein